MSSPETYSPPTGRRRREYARFPLNCTVRLVRGSVPLEATTSEVSCDGFSFHSQIPFQLGESLECELVIPSGEIASKREPLILDARARVVRIVEGPQGTGHDVACQIEDFTIASTRQAAIE